MLGVGPGALASDAYMLGIEPAQQRDMMEEALEAIIALLTSPEPVSRKTSWFTLQDARLQLRPYSQPTFEIAVAAMVSPSGPRLASKYGCSLLSVSATTVEGFSALGSHWDVMEEQSARLVLKGLSSAEIAEVMGISEKTVKQHLTQIYAKTGVAGRAEFFHLVFPS